MVAAKKWAASIEEKAKAKEMAVTMTEEENTAEKEEGEEKDVMPVFQLSSEQKMYNLYKDHLLQVLAEKREKSAFPPLLITPVLSHILSPSPSLFLTFASTKSAKQAQHLWEQKQAEAKQRRIAKENAEMADSGESEKPQVNVLTRAEGRRT